MDHEVPIQSAFLGGTEQLSRPQQVHLAPGSLWQVPGLGAGGETWCKNITDSICMDNSSVPASRVSQIIFSPQTKDSQVFPFHIITKLS